MYKLPKKIKRSEANVDGKVAQFLWKYHPHSFALEVKMKNGVTEDHQRIALRKVSSNTFKPLKLADTGRRNPFDYIGLRGADAILCIVDGKKVTCTVNETYELRFTI